MLTVPRGYISHRKAGRFPPEEHACWGFKNANTAILNNRINRIHEVQLDIIRFVRVVEIPLWLFHDYFFEA